MYLSAKTCDICCDCDRIQQILSRGEERMIWIYIIFAVIVLWLIAIRPENGRRDRMNEFSKVYIAHRGFHDNDGDAPENTMAAFRKAVEAGYGIELDVRETKDGQLVISHDDSLKRTAGIDRKISEMNYSEFRDVNLFHSKEHVPLFRDVLEMIDGRVPVVVEIKSENLKKTAELCESAAFWMDSYEGLTCMESFNPLALYWFKKHHPLTLRGQLSERFHDSRPLVNFGLFFLSLCILNFLTRPDFIAYNIHHAHLLRYRVLRRMNCFGAGWTVRSAKELKEAQGSFDAFIFEGFKPEETVEINNEKLKAEKRDMSDMIRVHTIVHGQVQGVGFRYRATYIAQALGVSGWVRNEMDGSVEMELQGTRQMIDRMMDRLKNERFVEITDVEEKEIPVEEHEYEFKVRY